MELDEPLSILTFGTIALAYSLFLVFALFPLIVLSLIPRLSPVLPACRSLKGAIQTGWFGDCDIRVRRRVLTRMMVVDEGAFTVRKKNYMGGVFADFS